MKTSRLLILVVALMVGVGFAAVAQTAAPAAPMLGQPGSLIEVYGVIDGALRFADNASTLNYGEFYLSQGLFNGSRVGFRGTEGLGAGFKAVYDLETGVVLPTGQLDQQGQIFGRQAWIGVDSDYGRLTFGRVYGTFSDAIGTGDVFGAGHGNQPYWSSSSGGANNYASNDAVNAFFLQESGLRWDNSIKYESNFYGVTLGGQVALGDIPNSAQVGYLPQNTMYAVSLGYNSKNFPVSGTAAFQTEVDTAYRSHNDYGLGAKYAFDATDAVYVFYFYSVFDNYFAQISPNDSEMKGAALNNQRTDNIINVAVNYYVMPNLNLIASFYYDYAQNILASGDWGDRISGLLVVDYYFTKNFDAYIAASYSNFDGNLQQTPNGGDQYATAANNVSYVFSAMTGMRFRF